MPTAMIASASRSYSNRSPKAICITAGPIARTPSEGQHREAGDHRERRLDRGVKSVLATTSAHTGEVGEEARRDALEDQDGRADDHQDVEDEPGCGGVVERPDEERAGVQEDLLADHDHEHRAGESATRRERDPA